jgi:hypothetical protein
MSSIIFKKYLYAKDFMQRELTEWGRVETNLDKFLIGEIKKEDMLNYLKDKLSYFNNCKNDHILKKEYFEYNLASIFDQIFEVLNTEISRIEALPKVSPDINTKNIQETLKYFDGKCIKKTERGNWIITKVLHQVIIDFECAILKKYITYPSKNEEIRDFILSYLKTKKGNSLKESYDKYENRKTQKKKMSTNTDKRRQN